MTAAIAPPRDDAERCDWLRLIRSANVGPIGFLQLLARFGSAARALERLPDLAARGGRRQPRICSRGEAERELAAVRAFGADWLALGEPAYPAALAATADPPPLIAVKGDRDLLGRPILAIVGARNASASGRRFSRDIAHELGAAGYVIASGLARGIDAAAHAGALAHGTVGVAAGGIDIAYPPQHAELQAEIGERGALVGEVRLGTRPQARHFPRRNRLVSGLARGVLVVEAALKSGSLITARYAAEQGREVLAVPGSPRDPRARGCNDLIRNGAVLVESADDVLRALAFGARAPEPAAPEPTLEPAGHEEPDAGDSVRAHDAVRELLSPTPVEVDELVRQSQLTPSVVLTILLELELAGRLARHPGNRVSLPASSP